MPTPSILIIPDRYKAAVLYSQIPDSGAVDFDVTRATTAYRTNASGLLESVASGVPRLDYPAAGGCPSLLVEPAATNLVFRSEEFDDAAWSKLAGGVGIAPAVTANAGVAPNGTTTADRIVFNPSGTTSVDSSVISQGAVGLTSGTVLTMSVYLRSNTGSNQTIILYDGNAGAATRTTATVTTSWQRFTFTRTIAGTSFVFRFGSIGNINAGVQDILAWGAQLEVGSVATSYIPTIAATATRNADVISKTGVSGFIGQTEGTIYAEVDFSRAGKTSAQRLIELTDDTVANRLVIAFGNDTSIITRVTTATVEQASFTATVAFGILKVALAYSSAGCVLFINGVNLASNSSATIPACTKINLGSTFGGVSQLNDRIRAAAIYTTRLDNAQLAALTTL